MKHTFGEFAELLSNVQCCPLAREAYLLEMARYQMGWQGRCEASIEGGEAGEGRAERHCNKDESMLSLPNSGIVMEFCNVSAGSFSL